MTKAGGLVAYYRVSRQSQARSGLGLAAQKEAVAQFAAANGVEIVAEFEEVETGKGADALDRRPQLAAALDMAKKTKGTVAVAKLDRLSRDVSFISNLMSKRVPFVVTELGFETDPFLLHLYAALGEAERRFISSRTRLALAQKRAQNVKLGNPVNLKEAGQKGAQRQKEDADARAATITWFVQNLRDQRKTHRQIADALNASPHRPARGDTWHRSTVANVMKRTGIA